MNSWAIKDLKLEVSELISDFLNEFTEIFCRKLKENQMKRVEDLIESMASVIATIILGYTKSLNREHITCIEESTLQISSSNYEFYRMIDQYRAAKNSTSDKKYLIIHLIYKYFEVKTSYFTKEVS